MKTAMRENPNFWVHCSGAQRMPWPIETPPAHSTGLESKTVSGGGDNFSLDFPFYRTGQKWGTHYIFLGASVLTPHLGWRGLPRGAPHRLRAGGRGPSHPPVHRR